MAFASGGKYERPSRQKRFFGPAHYCFKNISTLPAVAHSQHAINFYKGIATAATAAGSSPVTSVTVAGGHASGNYIKYGETGTSSGPINEGNVINFDDVYDQPFRIGEGIPETELASTNLEKARYNYSGSIWYLLPDPNDYTVYWRDFGRNPPADAFDNHAYFVSRKDILVGLIHYSVAGGLGDPGDRINAGHVNAWRARLRDGRFNYAAAATKRDVMAQIDPDGNLGTYSGANGINWTRFLGAYPEMDYNTGYGVVDKNFRADGASKYQDMTNLFAHINGGGVPMVDHIAHYEEFVRGIIKHQLICYVWEGGKTGTNPHDVWNNADRNFRWPAMRGDGLWEDSDVSPIYWDAANGAVSTTQDGPGYERVRIPQYGWIVRLKASSYLSALDELNATTHVGAPFAKIMLRALHEYGAIIMDKNTTNGGSHKLYTGTTPVSDLAARYPHDNIGWYAGNGSNITRNFCFKFRIGYDSRFPAINTEIGTDTVLDRNIQAHVDAAQTKVNTHDAMSHCIENDTSLSFDDFEFVDMEALNLHDGDVWSMEAK